MLPYFILRTGGYLAYYACYLAYSCVTRLLLVDPAAIVFLVL